MSTIIKPYFLAIDVAEEFPTLDQSESKKSDAFHDQPVSSPKLKYFTKEHYGKMKEHEQIHKWDCRQSKLKVNTRCSHSQMLGQ